MMKHFLQFAVFALFTQTAMAQGLLAPNNYTTQSSIPMGCLHLSPFFFPVPDEVVYDDSVSFVSNQPGDTATYRVRVWRIGCHEPGRSAIAIHFQETESSQGLVFYPLMSLPPPGGAEADAYAFLYPTSEPNFLSLGDGILNFTSSFFSDGVTYVVDSPRRFLSPEQYNQEIVLSLFNGGPRIDITIPVYDPSTHAPQLDKPGFHGRYSGQWVIDELPNSGLLLQVGEVPDTDRNFVFAIWFTYFGGVPTWVVGNRDFDVGANEISLDMLAVSGGEFLTRPGSFTKDDIDFETAGTMTLRANHCNELEADVDFTPIGEGATSLTLSRLIRIAGYDCDQTQ